MFSSSQITSGLATFLDGINHSTLLSGFGTVTDNLCDAHRDGWSSRLHIPQLTLRRSKETKCSKSHFCRGFLVKAAKRSQSVNQVMQSSRPEQHVSQKQIHIKNQVCCFYSCQNVNKANGLVSRTSTPMGCWFTHWDFCRTPINTRQRRGDQRSVLVIWITRLQIPLPN